MQVAQLLVGADGIHVGVDTITRLDVILSQRQAFPFSQRVNHFGLGVAQVLDREGDCTLNAVQVVVDTHPLQHKQRGRDATQTQLGREIKLEKLLNLLDTQLGLAHVEEGLVSFGKN